MTEADMFYLADTAPLENAIPLSDGNSYYVFDDERYMIPYVTFDYIVITDGHGGRVGCVTSCLSSQSDRGFDGVWHGDIFLCVKPEHRGKGFVSKLVQSGEIRRVFPDVEDVTIASDSVRSEADFNCKLHLAKLAGYDVANEASIRERIADGSMNFDAYKFTDGKRSLVDGYVNVFEYMVWDEHSEHRKYLDSYLDDRNDVLGKKGWLLWRVMDRYLSLIYCAKENVVSLDEKIEVKFDENKSNPLQAYCDAVNSIIGENLSADELNALELLLPCEWIADDVYDFDTDRFDIDAVPYVQEMSRSDLCLYRMIMRLAQVCQESGWKMVVSD